MTTTAADQPSQVRLVKTGPDSYEQYGGVASTGDLNANQLLVGNGGTSVRILGARGTTTTVLHGHATATPSFGAVYLRADVSSELPEANGGTGQASYTKGDLLVATSSTGLVKLAVGANGFALLADSTTSSGVRWSTISAGVAVLHTTKSGAAYVNRTDQQDIYRFSVPGNTLGTKNKIRLTVTGRSSGAAIAGGNICTLRTKYGGTTLFSHSIQTDDGVAGALANEPFTLDVIVSEDGVTNSQIGHGVVLGREAVAGGVLSGTARSIVLRGTAAIDDTAAQLLVVSAQHSVAEAGTTLTLESACAESIT